MGLARTVALVLLLLIGCAPSARADDVEPMKQMLLYLRVLAYDRNLKSRASDILTVAIVRRPRNAESEEAANELASALADIGKRTTVSGLALKAAVIEFKDGASFEEALGAVRATALYVVPGLDDSLSAISAAARRRGVVSGAGREPFIRRGLSIGVIERDGKPSLLINLPASRAEGADLDATVLRVADVIR